MHMRKRANAIVLALLLAVTARADIFNFVVDGEVFLTLEVNLTGRPAELSDIGPVRFTDRGNQVFGFGTVYQGSFDVIRPENFPYFVVDDDGGLGGSNADNVRSISFQDFDPPPSTTGVIGFDVRAALDTGPDLIGYGFLDPSFLGGIRPQQLQGHFLPVPEPNISLWCVMALTAAGARARRRRSRTNRR